MSALEGHGGDAERGAEDVDGDEEEADGEDDVRRERDEEDRGRLGDLELLGERRVRAVEGRREADGDGKAERPEDRPDGRVVADVVPV